MLPSKGYLKSIDCPFYENNLCHRFYCHYRHRKGKTNKSNFTTRHSEVISDLSRGRFNDTHGNSRNRHHNNKCSECSDIGKELASYFIESDELHKINSKTTNKIDVEKTSDSKLSDSDQLMKNYDKHENQGNENNYLMTGHDKGNSQTKEVTSDSRSEFNQLKSTVKYIFQTENIAATPSKELFFNSKESLPKERKTDIAKNLADTLMTDKNFKYDKPKEETRETITYTSDTSNPKVTNNCKHSTGAHINLHDFPINLHNTKNSYYCNKKVNTGTNNNERKNLSKELLQIPVIEISDSELSETYDELDEIVRSIQEMHNIINKSQNFPEPKREIVTDSKKYDKIDDILKTVQEIPKSNDIQKDSSIENNHRHCVIQKYSSESNAAVKNKLTKRKCILESEKHSNKTELGLSYSEDTNKYKYDKLDGIIKNIHEKQNFNSTEGFRRTKKKISHVKRNDLRSNRKLEFQPRKIKTITTSSLIDNPIPKKKVRVAHTISESNNLLLKETREYLAYWSRVKERVKNKFKNQSGKDYQNWSNVKISPVLNVSSILNSKNVLNTEINQWNSTKK